MQALRYPDSLTRPPCKLVGLQLRTRRETWTSTWKVSTDYCRLTQGAFVLIGGRLGDVFGHKKVLVIGAVRNIPPFCCRTI